MSESKNTFDGLFDEEPVKANEEKPDEGPHEFADNADSSEAQVSESPKRDINDPPLTTAELVRIKNVEEDFDNLIAECQKTFVNLPFQGTRDYLKAKSEIAQKRIDFEESPSPFDLSRQIASVQVMKDDMLRIYANAHLNHTIRNKIQDTLTDAYCVVSQAKSADKRKGEAAMALSQFAIASAEAEAFYDYCKKMIDNLESQYKTISRRISCLEMQLTLGELQTSPSTEDIDKSKKRLIKDYLEEKKRLDSKPGNVEW